MQLIAYTIYLSTGFTVTVLVGKHLYTNGYHLIMDLFSNDRALRCAFRIKS